MKHLYRIPLLSMIVLFAHTSSIDASQNGGAPSLFSKLLEQVGIKTTATPRITPSPSQDLEWMARMAQEHPYLTTTCVIALAAGIAVTCFPKVRSWLWGSSKTSTLDNAGAQTTKWAAEFEPVYLNEQEVQELIRTIHQGNQTNNQSMATIGQLYNNVVAEVSSKKTLFDHTAKKAIKDTFPPSQRTLSDSFNVLHDTQVIDTLIDPNRYIDNQNNIPSATLDTLGSLYQCLSFLYKNLDQVPDNLNDKLIGSLDRLGDAFNTAQKTGKLNQSNALKPLVDLIYDDLLEHLDPNVKR